MTNGEGDRASILVCHLTSNVCFQSYPDLMTPAPNGSVANDPNVWSGALCTIENASPSEQLAQHRPQNVGVVVRPRPDTRPRSDFVPSWPKRKVAEIGPAAR